MVTSWNTFSVFLAIDYAHALVMMTSVRSAFHSQRVLSVSIPILVIMYATCVILPYLIVLLVIMVIPALSVVMASI